MTETIALAVSELIFQSRIRAAAEALGLAIAVADVPASLDAAIATRPAALVVDLQDRGIDPVAAIGAAKAAGLRVLAFGRHTDAASLRAARTAGADTVVPRSQLNAEMPALLRALVELPDTAKR
jgi:DNA-binding NarL/FixJ family response regulator